MSQKENNIIVLTIKAEPVSQEEINQLKPKLLAQFNKYFSDFLDYFKDLDSILNHSQDKNFLYYFEEINKSLAIFVREAESINTDKSKTNNYTNLERSIKRQLNFLSKISYSNFVDKPLLIAIDNVSINLFALTRFLHDIFNIEKSFLKQSTEEMTATSRKELLRITNEFKNRYPRFNFIKLEIKDYSDEVDVKFVNPAQDELKRKVKDTVPEIKARLEEYLNWELRKIGINMKCFMITGRTNITLAYSFDDEDEEKPDVCDNCQKKTKGLSHFDKAGIDEFVCDDCFISYLLSEG